MTIFEIYYSAMERAFGDYPSTSKSTRNPLSPRLARGFFFAFCISKKPSPVGEGGPRQRWMRSYLKIENTSSVTLRVPPSPTGEGYSILPLILQALALLLFLVPPIVLVGSIATGACSRVQGFRPRSPSPLLLFWCRRSVWSYSSKFCRYFKGVTPNFILKRRIKWEHSAKPACVQASVTLSPADKRLAAYDSFLDSKNSRGEMWR